MRKILSLVLALCLALGCAAFAEGALPAICDAEYTLTVNGTDALIVADAENVTFDITEDILSQAVAAGLETVTFKAGNVKTTIKLASMLAIGTHFNITLNNDAEMDEGEAKCAAGVAKSSARVAYLLVNEDGTTEDVANKLDGSLTLYVAWDGKTNSIRAITNNGSGYQRTQMNCDNGYEDGMTTVTCYRLFSTSYITLEDEGDEFRLDISGFPANGSKLGTTPQQFDYLVNIGIIGVPKGEEITIYWSFNGEKEGSGKIDNPMHDIFGIAEYCFLYNSANHKHEVSLKIYASYNGRFTNSVTYNYYCQADPD